MLSLSSSSIDVAVWGKCVLHASYFSIKNFRVAVIEEYGAVIEFIATSHCDDGIWNYDRHHDPLFYLEL